MWHTNLRKVGLANHGILLLLVQHPGSLGVQEEPLKVMSVHQVKALLVHTWIHFLAYEETMYCSDFSG